MDTLGSFLHWFGSCNKRTSVKNTFAGVLDFKNYADLDIFIIDNILIIIDVQNVQCTLYIDILF